MPPRKLKFREPVAVLQRRNVAAMAAMAGSAEQAAAIQAEFEPLFKRLPVKRAPSTAKSEKEIQTEILNFLRDHPLVAWAHRFNRGTAVSQDEHGRHYHIKFNTCPGFSDIHFLFKSGRPGYVEVKVPGKSPTDDQADFLPRQQFAEIGGHQAGLADARWARVGDERFGVQHLDEQRRAEALARVRPPVARQPCR